MGRTKSKKKRGLSILAISLMVVLSTTGCSTFNTFTTSVQGVAEDGNVVRIGIYEPLTGSDRKGGEQEVMGIELAHEIYPTVAGKTVELLYGDNRSDLTLAEKAAAELVNQKVDVILGSYGNTLSLAGGPIFQRAKIPAIAITNTNPLVTIGNPYYFRVSIVDSFQGVMAAKYVYNDLGLQTAAVIRAKGDDYGAALSQAFSDKMIALTGNPDAIVKTVEYPVEETDFSEQIDALKEANIEVAYMTGSAEDGAAMVKQAKSKGLTVQFIGTDLWHQESLIKEAGLEAEGLVFTTFVDLESELTQETDSFLNAFHQKYGQDVQPENAVALGYDAYLVALDALARQDEAKKANQVSTEGAIATGLMEVLASTRDFPGATGRITFDENGDPIKSVVFITVENGEFIHKYTAEPQWN